MNSERFISLFKARDAHKELKAMLKCIEVSYLPETIAKGKVKKELYYKRTVPAKSGDLTEIAALTVDIGAEILSHPHTEDEEWYVVPEFGSAEKCECGNSHGYINELDHPVTIISIKLAVIV